MCPFLSQTEMKWKCYTSLPHFLYHAVHWLENHFFSLHRIFFKLTVLWFGSFWKQILLFQSWVALFPLLLLLLRGIPMTILSSRAPLRYNYSHYFSVISFFLRYNWNPKLNYAQRRMHVECCCPNWRKNHFKYFFFCLN